MNNESIKEILDSLKFVIDNPTLEDEVGDEQVTIINYTELNAEESKQLLDYITNLQEENEILKEENKHIFANVNDDELLRSNAMNYAEAQDYKSRCEKAIEYISEHLEREYFDDDILETNTIYNRDLFKVKNILQGDDKE